MVSVVNVVSVVSVWRVLCVANVANVVHVACAACVVTCHTVERMRSEHGTRNTEQCGHVELNSTTKTRAYLRKQEENREYERISSQSGFYLFWDMSYNILTGHCIRSEYHIPII